MRVWGHAAADGQDVTEACRAIRSHRFESEMQKHKAARAIKAALNGADPPHHTPAVERNVRFVTPGEFTAGFFF